jgi:hypothetical protein
MKQLEAEVSDRRRRELEATLRGDAYQLDIDHFDLLIEIDTPTEQHDHLRLLRAANLAIQGWIRRSVSATRRKCIQKVAAACCVDATSLDASVLVLRGEIKYRQVRGLPAETTLPRLIESASGRRDQR